MAATKICKKCGLERLLLHYDSCIREQTRQLLDSTKDLFEKEVSFADLYEKGSDSITLDWCRRSLELYESLTDETEKQLVLFNIGWILKIQNYGAGDTETSPLQCERCSGYPEVCPMVAEIKQGIIDRIDFGEKMEKEILSTTFNHIRTRFVCALLNSYDHAEDTGKHCITQIYWILTGFIRDDELRRTLEQIDAEIWG